ncbi:MAG: radical SAM protein [Clostridiales bacterium]|nr:radical SAM protein [Clostridiales bacterium]
MNSIEEIKTQHLIARAGYRDYLFREPQLHQLFLELTSRCNLRCEHCGSSCGDVPVIDLPADAIHELLSKVKHDFDISRMMLCITGGEPMLHPGFFGIMEDARSMGYRWGMTSNATLIDDAAAMRLRDAGMSTISVSIDGLPSTHDAMRGTPGAYDKAMRGINALLRLNCFKAVQVTTVVTQRNIGELDRLFDIMQGLDIDSWRLTAIEPIGRALKHPELLLTPENHRYLLSFIKSKRLQGIPLEYGCCHFLGLEYEREVRNWYYLCSAGRLIASVMANGDIGACLDIERNEKTIQGNIFRDDFTEVWKNRFGIFRQHLSERNESCRSCPVKLFCDGDSAHSWDFENDAPRLCMRGILFD